MNKLVKAIFCTNVFIVSVFASGASEPFNDKITTDSKPESTQEWIERNLRARGKLKEGQHLRLDQLWAIVDILEQKARQRQSVATH